MPTKVHCEVCNVYRTDMKSHQQSRKHRTKYDAHLAQAKLATEDMTEVKIDDVVVEVEAEVKDDDRVGATNHGMITNIFNNVAIRQRSDGYICATDMCKAGGKLWADYMRLGEANEFAAELGITMGIPINKLIESKTGRYGGTWIHPKIGIHLAQWISAKFAVRAHNWLYGYYQTNMAKTETAAVVEQQQDKILHHIANHIKYKPDNWTPERIDMVIKTMVGFIQIDESKETHPIPLRYIAELIGVIYGNLVRLLLESFTESDDYKCLSFGSEKQKNTGSGGHNKKEYMLSVDCMAELIMLSRSKNARIIKRALLDIIRMFKECLRDPSNQVIDTIRNEVKQRASIQDQLPQVQQEIAMADELKDCNVIYFNELLDADIPDKTIYKFGITFRLNERPDEHRRRFGALKLIKAINVDHLTYKQGRDIETHIRTVAKRLDIMYPYKNSSETIALNKDDDINALIAMVEERITSITTEQQPDSNDTLRLQIQLEQIKLDQLRIIHHTPVRVQSRDQPGETDEVAYEGQPTQSEETQTLHRQWIWEVAEANPRNIVD